MPLRFQDSRTVTVRPGDVSPVTIGEAVLGEGDDTLWIRVRQTSSGADCPWPWSYALVFWETAEGRELGTVKINGVCEGEVFALGVGLPPSQRTGILYLQPRSYNLAWVNKGNPWTLSFQYYAGRSNGSGGARLSAVANSLVDPAGNGLALTRVNFP